MYHQLETAGTTKHWETTVGEVFGSVAAGQLPRRWEHCWWDVELLVRGTCNRTARGWNTACGALVLHVSCALTWLQYCWHSNQLQLECRWKSVGRAFPGGVIVLLVRRLHCLSASCTNCSWAACAFFRCAWTCWSLAGELLLVRLHRLPLMQWNLLRPHCRC